MSTTTTTNMQSRKNLPYKLHRKPNNAQNTQHKLGVAFSYLERKHIDLDKGISEGLEGSFKKCLSPVIQLLPQAESIKLKSTLKIGLSLRSIENQ